MRICVVLALVLGALATHAADYPTVERGRELSFPHDEGAHPQYRSEWWYVTGWLEDERGAMRGFQITFFRARPGFDEDNPSSFAARQLLFAHAAISDPQRGALMRDEKSARAGFGLAEAKEGALDVHIDDWALRRAGEQYIASVRARDFALDLTLDPTPPLLHGVRGFSQKSPTPTHASYYYSQPQLATRGRIVIDGREHTVNGSAWLDHEWMTSVMHEDAQGWDWVGLNLDDGGALVALQMRTTADGKEHWAFGAQRDAMTKRDTTYGPDQIAWTALRRWRSPRTGVTYPIEWRIVVDGRTITLKPLMDDQENDARHSTGTLYWEGAVRAYDDQGRQIGRGYLELTGYGQRLRF